MSLFRKKKPKEKEFFEDSDQVFLYRGVYYFSTERNHDASNTFTVIPGDNIPYEKFRELALDCAEKMLSASPVILNNLYCYSLEPVEGTLSEDDCAKRYVAQGGTPIFAAKNELYTVSRGIDRLLIECVPEKIYGYYGLSFYRHNLMENSSFKRDLTIHYHEDHQYLEISALDDVSKCVDIVLEVCKKHGKQVVLPKE